MLESHNKVNIPDLHGKNDVEIEINSNKASQEGRVLRVRIGENTAYINYKDLYGLVWVMGNEEEQDNLMPVRSTTMRTFFKQHRVIAKKDIKKGEFIVVNCKMDVPTTITEGLKGLMGKDNNKIIHRI